MSSPLSVLRNRSPDDEMFTSSPPNKEGTLNK